LRRICCAGDRRVQGQHSPSPLRRAYHEIDTDHDLEFATGIEPPDVTHRLWITGELFPETGFVDNWKNVNSSR
jgi:hypothetical protein